MVAPTPPRSDQPDLSFAEIMGRLFELGFNTGLLTAIAQRTDLTHHFGTLYENDLSHLQLPPLIEAAQRFTRPISSFDRDMLQQWVHFLLLKGYLAGSNFLVEFLQTICQGKDWEGEIVYLQCSVTGKNSLGIHPSPGIAQTVEALMAQFTHASQHEVILNAQELAHYQGKGEFLNADTLLLLRDPNGWRLLCVDLSVFGLRTLSDTHDLSRVSSLRSMLLSEMRYLRSRSVFTNLSIDTNDDATAHELLSRQLKQYFTAFKRRDKETAKFIQAASYTSSFYHFLLQKQILASNTPLSFHVVGYTDRAMNAMTLKRAQLPLLKTCAAIYQQHHSDEEIDEARHEVIGTIERAANRSFQRVGEQQFATSLLKLAEQGDQLSVLDHTETLDHFVNTVAPLDPTLLSSAIREHLPADTHADASIRDIHRALVYQELASPDLYLFLTGHPGIGKTTAIARFLQERARQGEGFLFLYISPRKQVNLDIFEKFREAPGCLNFFGLTTNSLAIRNNHPRPTVHYFSDLCQDTFQANGVTFLPAEQVETTRFKDSLRQLEEIQENLLIDKGEQVSGVLKSLCSGLAASLTDTFPAARTLSNAQPRPLSIVATVAIQSLKRTATGKNTLHHLDSIFKSATANGRILPANMRQISQRIRHFFVMIDEVTGDEGGAEFLDGIHTFIHKYQLASYGINTKIIVADASIVDTDVIKSHLEHSGYEPNKIYFRRVDSQQPTFPLTRDEIRFKRCKSVVINANAYPASSLRVNYRILTDIFRYEEERYLERYKIVRDKQQQLLVEDITALMERSPEGQILVYIQDKQRLAELITTITQRRGEFVRGTHYQEIHANISEKHKREIQESQDRVQVIFMTASASRGLSFKRAKHILVDIPHFAIEQNLMEILQVIYRGRGGDFDQDEKTLTFYLADRIAYPEQADRELALKESLLHLLNVMLILKTAIMTRIEGSGQLGLNQRFRMIPIGGKSVLSAGETFSKRLSDLLKELQTLANQTWSNKRILNFMINSLRFILSQSHIQLVRTTNDRGPYLQSPRSYLEQLPTFATDFSLAAQRGFDHLLKLPLLESAYLSGGLLVVPIIHKSMRELYRASIEEALKRPRPEDLPDLLTCMELISRDTNYPESLRASLSDAILLVKELQKLSDTKSASYEQESQHEDQHYAFPLFTFLSYQHLQTYFETEAEAEEQAPIPFRELLRLYISALYPADGFLPIGRAYKTFPFVAFRSFQLGETRQRSFTEKYLFTSPELNIINMLLSGK